MKKMFSSLSVAIAALLLSCVAWSAGDADRGKSKVAVCGACHGNDGNSLIAANPKLAGQGEQYLLKQLRDIQSGARSAPLMTGMLNGLDDADLADVAAYYASQTQTKSVAKAEWLELGKELYRAGNRDRGIPSCTGCHGPAGMGNAPAKYPMISGQHADYIAQQLRNFSLGERTNDGEARVMRDIAERMNENEIKAVASYAAGLRP